MYRTGWGFQARLEDLALAALVWQRVLRPWRLVRQRHLARLRDAEDTVNLASLPAELIQIIEDQVASNAFSEPARKIHFEINCPCDAFNDEFYGSDEFRQGLEDFIEENSDLYVLNSIYEGRLGSITTVYADYNSAHEAFVGSPECEEILEAALAEHQKIGDCEAERAREVAWECILASSPMSDEESQDADQIREILDALAVFEEDFGLVRFGPAADLQPGSLAEAKVAILFRERSQTRGSQPGDGQVISQPCIDSDQLLRFQSLFGLSTAQKTGDLCCNELSWFIVDCCDWPDYLDGVEEVKTEKEVEEHNAKIEEKRKAKAKQRGDGTRKKGSPLS